VHAPPLDTGPAVDSRATSAHQQAEQQQQTRLPQHAPAELSEAQPARADRPPDNSVGEASC
jgi:hypothetical protein